MPNVSIIIPVFNTEVECFSEMLDSIKSQNKIFNIELVIIDDCSDENLSKIYLDLLNNLTNQYINITFIYKKLPINMGVGYCRNLAVNMSTNEFIFQMDSDDIMSPFRLDTQYEFMIKNPHYKICGSDCRLFSKDFKGNINFKEKTNFKPILTWDSFKKSYTNDNKNYWITASPTLCFKKSAALSIGNFNKELRYAEDIDFITRMLKKYNLFVNLKVKQALLLHRRHETNTTNFENTKYKKYFEYLHKNIKWHLINNGNEMPFDYNYFN